MKELFKYVMNLLKLEFNTSNLLNIELVYVRPWYLIGCFKQQSV